MDAEVIVVGAGPAGASAAFHLARRGRRVLLLDRHRFPRDKSCGDGLTRSAVRLLDEMGVLSHLAGAQHTRGVRVVLRGRGQRDFLYPASVTGPTGGLVVPRHDLDDLLCRAAVAAGAELREETTVKSLLHRNGAICGVEAEWRGEVVRWRAPVVIAADGAASPLARSAGLVETPAEELGVAIRGYFEGITDLAELLEIYLPLTDVTDRYLLPSYGWVFPVGPGRANIGVGLFERQPDANVRDLYDRFVDSLRAEDRRFAAAHPCGARRGAPLRFDFAPERCHAPGLVLVGDAAGMISPFTGEGISYAIESGKLAAEVIHERLNPDDETPLDLSEYGRLLGQRHTGYFETGRRSARRYLLVWHVLESTFHNEKPLFSLAREAVLFPEGIGESYTGTMLDDVGSLIEQTALPIRADLLAVTEMLVDTVRRDWPFLARVSALERASMGIPFRPALLLLLSAYVAGPAAPLAVRAAAAVELGYFAALAQASVGEEEAATIENGRANWGNMFAVMLGDFLLAKTYELSAAVGGVLSHALASALGVACEGRARELRHAHDPALSEAEHLAIVERKTATLFELPCRLGALLTRASPDTTRALCTYGRALGLAFQLTDDALDLRGQASQLGKATGADLREGVYNLAVLRALQGEPSRAAELRELLRETRSAPAAMGRVVKLVEETGAVDAALETARAYAAEARAALTGVPEGPAVRSLARLADYAVNRSA